MLSTASTTSQENIQRRSELTKSIEAALINTSDTLSLDKAIAQSSGVSSERVNQISQQVVNNILNSAQTTSSIAQHTGVSEESVKNILQSFSQQTMQPLNKIIESIEKITNISNEQVRLVLKETRSVVDRAQSLANITRMTKISDTKATDLLSQISHVTTNTGFNIEGIASSQAKDTSIPSQSNSIDTNSVSINTQSASSKTNNISANKSESLMNDISRRDATSSRTGDTSTTSNVLYTNTHANDSSNTSVVGDTTILGDISSGGGGSIFETEKVRDFTQAILKKTLVDESVISSIQTETGLSKKQIESTISIFSTVTSIADPKTLEKIRVTVGIEPPKALSIIQSAVRQLGSASNILGAPGKDSGLHAATEADLIKEQLATALDPEMQIDQIIPLPEEQSLDEYEEIRNLWVSQYEEGEVPTSEYVHTRLDWIKQDSTVITNILNKFLSKDAKMHQQALDEVGFIIPVFLINNLNGAQLITYLKAKLSAAKQVGKNLTKKLEDDTLAISQSENEEASLLSADHTVKDENTKHLEVDESGETREAK